MEVFLIVFGFLSILKIGFWLLLKGEPDIEQWVD